MRSSALSGLFLLVFAVLGTAEAGESPFTLTWTAGACRSCPAAASLADATFLGQGEAWGLEYRPPGETGAGDYMILDTRDGGKTWHELPDSYQHNDPPRVSFADARNGWVMVFNLFEAEQRLLSTRDGGRHWTRLPLRDLDVADIQDLGQGLGYAYRQSLDARHGDLLQTTDGGRHWRRTSLPEGFRSDRMLFQDRDHGIMAGCTGSETTIITTADGGAHWDVTRLDVPPPAPSINDQCAVMVDDLSVSHEGTALLTVSKHVFALGDTATMAFVFKSTDAGKTWSRTLAASATIASVEFASAAFLGDIALVARADRPSYLSQSDDQSDAPVHGTLLYSTDHGQSWQPIDLPRPVQACRSFGDRVTCVADDYRILTIGRAPP